MPTPAQITAALAARIGTIKQRRQGVYDEYARLGELAPFRETFLPIEEGKFTARQIVLGYVLEQYGANWVNRAGSYSQFTGGSSNPVTAQGADHHFELDFNFHQNGHPVTRVIRSVYIQSVPSPASRWATFPNSPLLLPVVVCPRGSFAPEEQNNAYVNSLGISGSGNFSLDCYIDINALSPGITTWFPMTITVSFEGGHPAQSVTLQAAESLGAPTAPRITPDYKQLYAPVYRTFPSAHVKDRFDAAWLGRKADTEYPKAFVILDDGAQKLQAAGRAVRRTSFIVMFVCKEGPKNEDGSPVISADASFGWQYGSEAEQISRFIEDLDAALKVDDTLGGLVMEARMEGFVSDAGLAHPEGAVWVKVEVEHHA